MGSFVTHSTNTASASISCTVTKPTGTISGDLLIACIAKTTTGTPTPPSGWDTISSDSTLKNFTQGTAFASGCGFYWKIAGGSEPADYTWTSTSGEWIITILCFRGINLPLVNSTGTPLEEALFDFSVVFSRSGTSLQASDEAANSDLTHDHYWYVVCPAINEAAATRTLSSLSAFLTQLTNNSLVGISMIAGYAEITLEDSGDNPAIGPTSCTIDNASGTARGYGVFISDPSGADKTLLRERSPNTKPARSMVVNA